MLSNGVVGIARHGEAPVQVCVDGQDVVRTQVVVPFHLNHLGSPRRHDILDDRLSRPPVLTVAVFVTVSENGGLDGRAVLDEPGTVLRFSHSNSVGMWVVGTCRHDVTWIESIGYLIDKYGLFGWIC